MKKWLIAFVLISPLLAILAPTLVNIAFIVKAPCDIFEARYSADAFLSYAGSALAAIATLSLACISIWQNRQIEKKNDELNKARDAWERNNTKRPFFAIATVTYGTEIAPSSSGDYCYEAPGTRKYVGPIVALANIGEGPALNIRVTPDTAFGEAPEELRERIFCPPGGIIERKLPVCASEGAESPGFFEGARIEYENMLGQAYYQAFEFNVREKVFCLNYLESAGRIGPPDGVPEGFCYEVVMKQISCQHTM